MTSDHLYNLPLLKKVYDKINIFESQLMSKNQINATLIFIV